MMQTLDLRNTQPSRADLARLAPRAATDVTAATASASELIADVRSRGEAALLDQAEKFDGGRPQRIRVHAGEIGNAGRLLDPAVRAALEASIERVTKATLAQVPE